MKIEKIKFNKIINNIKKNLKIMMYIKIIKINLKN